MQKRENPRVSKNYGDIHSPVTSQRQGKETSKWGKNLNYVASVEHQPQKPHANLGANWGLETQGLSSQKVDIAAWRCLLQAMGVP